MHSLAEGPATVVGDSPSGLNELVLGVQVTNSEPHIAKLIDVASFSLILVVRVWSLILFLVLGTLVSLAGVISTAALVVVVVTHSRPLSVLIVPLLE